MAEPVVEENHSSFSSELGSIDIALPPSDDNFNSSCSDLRFLIDGDGDFELDFDQLCFPSENESFLVPTNQEVSGDFTPVSYISGDFELSTSAACCNRKSPRESTVASSSSPESGKVAVVDRKFKVEEATTRSATKRKKKYEDEEDTSHETKNNKNRRGDEENEDGDDEKRNTRLIRNRENAQLLRQRMKLLEEKVKNLHSTISDLNSKMSYFMAENAILRQQVVPPPYPPLVPLRFTAYMVKPQGFKVPLVTIPRLKPHQSAAKFTKKTKNVASISVLGLFFSLFLFGVLAPIVNISYGEYKSSYFTNRVYHHSRGRVSDSNRAHCGRDSEQGVGRNLSATENYVPRGNGSEPLIASLFVPRDEKLVKIEGNLIIHSTLASEKAMSSETKNQGKTGEATAKDFSRALPLPCNTKTRDITKRLYGERRKVLSSSGSDDTSEDKLKSTSTNGEMQQWFREGVAEPMFSSGMCTEVFQFDVSSTSEAVIPDSPATQQLKNTTDTHKGKDNRRILRGSLPVSDFNQTRSSKENFRETKPHSSMVVSLLVDPKEGSDGDINGMMGGTKSLSRVFIVVLVDSVKYVTYSCVLPRPEVPPLMTT